MSKRIWADQAHLDRATLVDHARALGLDRAAFERAIDSSQHQATIDADVQASNAAGIRGTPGFVINGFFVSGAQPVSKFRRLIDRALSKRSP